MSNQYFFSVFYIFLKALVDNKESCFGKIDFFQYCQTLKFLLIKKFYFYVL